MPAVADAPRRRVAKAEPAPERIIALVAGESGTGKSFFVASLPNALIIDTDIGGGLRYADRMIEANQSQRVGPGVADPDFDITISEYPELLDFLTRMDRTHQIDKYTTLVIDHLTTLQDNAVDRHNPKMDRDFGRSGEMGTKEWKKIREFCRNKDFNLVTIAHLKGKWAQDKEVGKQAAGPKEVIGDMDIAVYLQRNASGGYPSNGQVVKWRRLPSDERGPVPSMFPFTFDNFLKIDGTNAFTRGREPVALASAEQVAEVTKLLEVAKVDEKEITKWFKAAGAESWAEFPAPRIDSAIKYIRNLIHTAANGQKAS
jgi:hypothetical protein